MPLSVAVVATLQFALAATFFVIPLVAYRCGGDAQQAAEAEVRRQGFPAGVLERHRVRFTESAAGMVFPLAIAAYLATLASLVLAGSGTGRILSWVSESILMLGGGFVTAAQVFAARYVEAAFRKSDDETVRGIDARAVVGAAQAAFPSWLRPLLLARFALITLGSLVVIVLLTTSFG